jgi:hypothetical protein
VWHSLAVVCDYLTLFEINDSELASQMLKIDRVCSC